MNIEVSYIDTSKIAYEPKYVAVFDMTKEDLYSLSEENEIHGDGLFIFPFYTGSVEDVPDFTGVWEKGYHHTVRPTYLGNFKNPVEVAHEYMDNVMGNLNKEMKNDY